MKEYKYQRWMHTKEIQDVFASLKVLDSYNKTSFNRKKTKDESLLLESVKYAHSSRLIYFVTVLDNAVAKSHIEVNGGFFRVYFLDELNRNYMSYDFNGFDDSSKWKKAIPEHKLFLSKMTIWDYAGDTDKKINISDYIFRPNGDFTVIERNLLSNEQIEKQSKSRVDISANWEEFPAFGDYESLIKKERGIKLLSI